MLTMTDLQSCVARLHKLNPPVDAVAEDFDGPPEWSSSDTGVCTATAAEDGLSALIAPVGASSQHRFATISVKARIPYQQSAGGTPLTIAETAKGVDSVELNKSGGTDIAVSDVAGAAELLGVSLVTILTADVEIVPSVAAPTGLQLEIFFDGPQ